MSFRRDKNESVAWRRWLARNRATLLTCGVPAVVYENKRNWWYFVEHGYFAPEGSASIVYVDTMPRDDALRPCLFLEREEAHRVHKSSALTRLQFLLGRQPVRQDDANDSGRRFFGDVAERRV